jgi:hypothetical protein
MAVIPLDRQPRTQYVDLLAAFRRTREKRAGPASSQRSIGLHLTNFKLKVCHLQDHLRLLPARGPRAHPSAARALAARIAAHDRLYRARHPRRGRLRGAVRGAGVRPRDASTASGVARGLSGYGWLARPLALADGRQSRLKLLFDNSGIARCKRALGRQMLLRPDGRLIG